MKNLSGHQFVTSPRSDQVRVWVREEGEGNNVQCAGWPDPHEPLFREHFVRILVIAVSTRVSEACLKELGRIILYLTGLRDIIYKISFGQKEGSKTDLIRGIFFITNCLKLMNN